MNHSSPFPLNRVDNERPPYYQRQHTVRYYAHRVKESLSTRVVKFICTIFLFIFFVVGLITFILWLSLRPHRPRFHIEDFSIATLAQTNVPPQSAVVHFNVSIRNANHKVTVHYDSIQCNVYYKDQSIAGATLVSDAFDQKSKTTMELNRDVSGLTVGGQLWSDMQHDRTAGIVALRLEITSTIKFEIYSWDSRRHKMHANCLAPVGQDGSILPSARGQRCPVYFT